MKTLTKIMNMNDEDFGNYIADKMDIFQDKVLIPILKVLGIIVVAVQLIRFFK